MRARVVVVYPPHPLLAPPGPHPVHCGSRLLHYHGADCGDGGEGKVGLLLWQVAPEGNGPQDPLRTLVVPAETGGGGCGGDCGGGGGCDAGYGWETRLEYELMWQWTEEWVRGGAQRWGWACGSGEGVWGGMGHRCPAGRPSPASMRPSPSPPPPSLLRRNTTLVPHPRHAGLRPAKEELMQCCRMWAEGGRLMPTTRAALGCCGCPHLAMSDQVPPSLPLPALHHSTGTHTSTLWHSSPQPFHQLQTPLTNISINSIITSSHRHREEERIPQSVTPRSLASDHHFSST